MTELIKHSSVESAYQQNVPLKVHTFCYAQDQAAEREQWRILVCICVTIVWVSNLSPVLSTLAKQNGFRRCPRQA